MQRVKILLVHIYYDDSWKTNHFRESNQEKNKRTDTINEAKKIKSNNFTRINR